MIDISRIINNKMKKKCIIVGDIILDEYVSGEVSKISSEAPIPILKVENKRYVLGGAANVAGNVQGCNIETLLCGVLGNDNEAAIIENILKDKNICFIGERADDRCTTLKTRIIGKNQQLVRIDCEDCLDISRQMEETLIENIRRNLSEISCVVLSDYNKGVCTDSFCKKLIEICNKNNIFVIVDPKCNDWTKYNGSYLITPNFKEFKEAVNKNINNTEKEITENAAKLFDKYNINKILVTRSQHGMTLIERGVSAQTFDTIQQEVYDVSGAGDTVIGTIAALLTMGIELKNAVEVSNYAAGLAVSKFGTYTITLDEVVNYIKCNVFNYNDKVIKINELKNTLNKWKTNGEKIVFTNGCFDILHIGHVDYINEASKLGTKMIIGLNSDSSVKRLKGEERPINNEMVRARMLAALQCVDAVVIFDEDTPENLIKEVCPDFLIKGGDYKIENIVGRQYAGCVKTIPLTDGFSTTNLIDKIKKS